MPHPAARRKREAPPCDYASNLPTRLHTGVSDFSVIFGVGAPSVQFANFCQVYGAYVWQGLCPSLSPNVRGVGNSRNSGKLGAPRLPLARKSSVDHVINKVIVDPLGLVLNALSPKTQPLGYGAALFILGCARDAHSVQAELPKGVIDQRPARSGREPLTLVLLAEPVAYLG